MSEPTAMIGTIRNLDGIEALRDIIVAGVSARDGYVLAPPGYKVEDIERFSDVPRALAGTFSTTDLAAFVAYVKHVNLDHRAEVFLNQEDLKVVARIDHGSPLDPGWGRHKAVLRLEKTPEFNGLFALTRQALTQADLAEWIVDWAPYLRFSTGDLNDAGQFYPESATMTPAQAIGAFRKLTLSASSTATNETQETGVARTLLESAKITSAVPSGMVMVVQPYPELPAEPFFVRFTYLPKDPPLIRSRIVGLQVQEAVHGKLFAEMLLAQLGDTVPVHLGTFS